MNAAYQLLRNSFVAGEVAFCVICDDMRMVTLKITDNAHYMRLALPRYTLFTLILLYITMTLTL